MYEPTAKGTWFKWSALDRAEKALAVASLACLVPGVLMTFRQIGLAESAYRAGYRLGSGGLEPSVAQVTARTSVGTPSPSEPVLAASLVGLGILFWILFSRRQDELFNRVQNRAYGLGSLITFGLMGLWLLLERVSDAPPLSTINVIVAWCAALTLVWSVEARRMWR